MHPPLQIHEWRHNVYECYGHEHTTSNTEPFTLDFITKHVTRTLSDFSVGSCIDEEKGICYQL